MLTKFGINSPQSGECRLWERFFKHTLMPVMNAGTVHNDNGEETRTPGKRKTTPPAPASAPQQWSFP